MASGVYIWSQTGASNANADSTVNYTEGQAPSSLNDSARNAMASVAKWRDDMSGAILTGGTSTAYTVTSYQQFDSLAHLDGQIVAFTPHATNGASPTLNVDSLGARGIVSASGVSIPAGTLIANTPYVALYNNTNTEFRLRGFFGNPYNIPLAASIEYWAATAPNSSFAFPYGQAISRSTYATLYGLIGNTYGAGDGSTTFNLPDLRGRVTASPDNMGGGDAGRLSNAASNIATFRNTLGGAGGEVAHSLITSEMPSHNHTATDSGHSHGLPGTILYDGGTSTKAYGSGGGRMDTASNNTAPASANISVSTVGGDGAHNNVQPTILCYRIMRII